MTNVTLDPVKKRHRSLVTVRAKWSNQYGVRYNTIGALGNPGRFFVSPQGKNGVQHFSV